MQTSSTKTRRGLQGTTAPTPFTARDPARPDVGPGPRDTLRRRKRGVATSETPVAELCIFGPRPSSAPRSDPPSRSVLPRDRGVSLRVRLRPRHPPETGSATRETGDSHPTDPSTDRPVLERSGGPERDLTPRVGILVGLRSHRPRGEPRRALVRHRQIVVHWGRGAAPTTLWALLPDQRHSRSRRKRRGE